MEVEMSKNVGGLDRFFRSGVGLLSLAIATISQGLPLQILFGIVGLFGLGTAITGHCPINENFGLDTTGKKEP